MEKLQIVMSIRRREGRERGWSEDETSTQKQRVNEEDNTYSWDEEREALIPSPFLSSNFSQDWCISNDFLLFSKWLFVHNVIPFLTLLLSLINVLSFTNWQIILWNVHATWNGLLHTSSLRGPVSSVFLEKPSVECKKRQKPTQIQSLCQTWWRRCQNVHLRHQSLPLMFHSLVC